MGIHRQKRRAERKVSGGLQAGPRKRMRVHRRRGVRDKGNVRPIWSHRVDRRHWEVKTRN